MHGAARQHGYEASHGHGRRQPTSPQAIRGAPLLGGWLVRGWVDETAMLEHMQRFPRSSALLRSILEVAVLLMHISAVPSPI